VDRDKSERTHGGLAQLARAPALQAGGHRFDSDILHGKEQRNSKPEGLLKRLKGSNTTNVCT
jgi:hypothetical protein